ncbi:MAG: DegV family protein [Lachnospiraceae bacterium]|nr:DegV family protein [Lachnospiraceae bacterium]MBR3638744.1 DegV family protein [Lachnospiraceae bacterium]
MSAFILTTESPADLSKEYYEETGIPYIPYHFQVKDGELLTDWVGAGMTIAQLSDMMNQGVVPKTSQPNTAEYEEFFEPYLQAGWDIFHVVFSSGLSGAYNACLAAVEELKEKYPERRIVAVDSRAAAPGFGLMVDEVYTRYKKGATMDELEDFVLKNRDHLQHWFYVTDLKYLKNGGRVSAASAAIGNMLNICPLMFVDKEGKLNVYEKIRGRKKIINATVEKMVQHAKDGTGYYGKCFIGHFNAYDEAVTLKEAIEERITGIDGGIRIFEIGKTIGAHSGPGTIALFFWGDEKVEPKS